MYQYLIYSTLLLFYFYYVNITAILKVRISVEERRGKRNSSESNSMIRLRRRREEEVGGGDQSTSRVLGWKIQRFVLVPFLPLGEQETTSPVTTEKILPGDFLDTS